MKAVARHRFAMPLLVLVNFLWAAQYPAYMIAGRHMSAAAVNFWALTIGMILLAPFWWREQRRAAVRSSPIRFRSTAIQFLVLGLFGIVPPSVMLAWGIAHSTASNAAILSLTIPVLMTLLGVVMLRERITLLRAACLGMALAGTLVISRDELSGDLLDTHRLAGNAVILLAGLGSAFYNAYGKVLLEKFTGIEVLMGSYLAGAAGCLIISLAVDTQPLYRVALPREAWLSIGVLGVFTWGVAMILWMWLLKRLAVSQISVSIYLLSFAGVLLSAVTLHERIRPAQLAGGALVVLSTYLTSEYENRRLSGTGVAAQ